MQWHIVSACTKIKNEYLLWRNPGLAQSDEHMVVTYVLAQRMKLRYRSKSGLACIKDLHFRAEKQADVFAPSLGPNRLTDGECLTLEPK